MLHRWVRKIKIVTGVPCSKGSKMMAESSAFGLSNDGQDLYLLGEKAREFLISQGIYRGDDLLSVKTGDLGEKYKAWREKKGYKKLKSPGGASSISGWKNVIRTAKGIKKTPSNSRRRRRSVTKFSTNKTSNTIKIVEKKKVMPTLVTPPFVVGNEQSNSMCIDQNLGPDQDNIQCILDDDCNHLVQPVDTSGLDDLIYLREAACSVVHDERAHLEDQCEDKADASEISSYLCLAEVSVMEV